MDFMRIAENLEALYKEYNAARERWQAAVRDYNKGIAENVPEEVKNAHADAKDKYIEALKEAVGLYMDTI